MIGWMGGREEESSGEIPERRLGEDSVWGTVFRKSFLNLIRIPQLHMEPETRWTY